MIRIFLPRDLQLQYLRNETLVIADSEYAKIFSFAMFDMKL